MSFIGNAWSKSEVANERDSECLTADSESHLKASSQVVQSLTANGDNRHGDASGLTSKQQGVT
eukprot:2296923-Rhodomonas_salina.1